MVLRASLPACATIIALITGCTVHDGGGSDPGPSDASSSRSAAADVPKWVHRVDTVELDAESISFEHGDHVLGTRSLRSGKSAVTILAALLGEGDRTSTEAGDGGVCLPASTSYDWDDDLRATLLTNRTSVGNDLDVRILAPTAITQDGRVVRLQGPDGVRVGDDAGARIAAAAPADKEQLQAGADAAWQVVLQPGWESSDVGAETNGVAALTDGTTVTVVGAPMPIRGPDGC